MARAPVFRRFTLEDFQDQKSWINKLFYPLNLFLGAVVTALTNGLTFRENLDAQIASITVATVTAVTEGTAYATTVLKTFVDANVNTGTENIAITAHGFATGDRIQLTSTGTLPAGLSLSTDYYVDRVDADNLKLSTTLANAFAGTVVNITAAAGGGTHTITRWAVFPPFAALQSPAQIRSTTMAKPQGLNVWSCIEQATNPSIIRNAIFCYWTYADSIITISHISGLEPNKTYNLVLMISGG